MQFLEITDDNKCFVLSEKKKKLFLMVFPADFEIKDTTESTTSASYLDLLLSIGRNCRLHTSIYDKRDDFNFHITKFPFLSSNIPSSPAYLLSLYDTPGLAPRMNGLF